MTISVLITLLVYLIIIGAIFWVINNVLPVEPPWLRKVANVVFAIIVLIVLLNFLGVLGGGHLVRIG